MKIGVRIFVYFVGLVLPLLAMLNCEGFNEGSMAVKSCVIDSELVKAYASFYFGWITISSFMLFIPVFFYILFVHLTSKKLAKIVSGFSGSS